MRDLKHLNWFENLLQEANNALIAQAKQEGKICVAFVCENTPEPLMNLGNAFGIRLHASEHRLNGHRNVLYDELSVRNVKGTFGARY